MTADSGSSQSESESSSEEEEEEGISSHAASASQPAPTPPKILSEEEMNRLGAKVLRAEMMGNEVRGDLKMNDTTKSYFQGEGRWGLSGGIKQSSILFSVVCQ